MRRALARLLLVSLVLLVPTGVAGQEEQGRLERLREQIEERETRAREYSDEAKSYLRRKRPKPLGAPPRRSWSPGMTP